MADDKVIMTEEEYRRGMDRIDELMKLKPNANTVEAHELRELAARCEEFEQYTWPLGKPQDNATANAIAEYIIELSRTYDAAARALRETLRQPCSESWPARKDVEAIENLNRNFAMLLDGIVTQIQIRTWPK